MPFVFQSTADQVATADDLVVKIDSEISTRDKLFAQIAGGLQFPDYFGGNWDALDECLRNLSWVGPKRVVIVHQALPQLSEDAVRTYLKILVRAVEDWRRDERHEVVVVFPEGVELRVRELLKTSNERSQAPS